MTGLVAGLLKCQLHLLTFLGHFCGSGGNGIQVDSYGPDDCAALKMKVDDLRPKGAGWQIRLHEKGGKHHTMPCHHALAEVLHALIAATGLAEDRKKFLFRTSPGHGA
jgi:integrase